MANDVKRDDVASEARFATRNEIDESFEKLTDADLLRLMSAARIFCYFNNIPGAEEDLLQECLVRVYRGDRKWNVDQSISLYTCLVGAMRSIAWTWGRTTYVTNKITGEPQMKFVTTVTVAEDELDILDTLPATGLRVTDEYDGDEAALRIMRLFDDDPDAVRVIEAKMLGLKGTEIQQGGQFSEKQYETICRRIVRRVEKHLRT